VKVPVIGQSFTFITDDSKACDTSCAFVATAQNTSYQSDALKRGAACIISPQECAKLLGVSPQLCVVGITGTNGKTTTAAAIYSILLDLHVKVALQGTRGCFINDTVFEQKSLTTPPILQTLWHMANASAQGCRYFIMEVSSHAIAQARIESLAFSLKIFTNLTQDHLDFHGSMAEYAATKSAFFQDDTLKLINKDSSHLVHYNATNAFTYGVEKPGQFHVKAYSLHQGIRAVIANDENTYHIESPLRGEFNLHNLLAAMGAVILLESPEPEVLCDAVEGFGGVSGRMEVINELPLVMVDFAHTPDGIEKVLDTMKHHELVVVFGAGGDRDASKRPLMGKIAKRFAKRLIVTSDNPRFEDPDKIIANIVQGVGEGALVEPDRKKAILLALEGLKPHETLMILGKGDEEYQDIKGVKYPYDDRAVVREWIASKQN
jgi:UDP-N-acetylmuramoyl-L-alanyl-D-glutamate--2,6-diaminopimelate ligase